MDRDKLEAVIDLVCDMARDYALETRIRRLLDDHREAGIEPRTLVMNTETWFRLVWELEGRSLGHGYFWTPQPEGSLADPGKNVTMFRGLPILIKDFLPDLEVIVGV